MPSIFIFMQLNFTSRIFFDPTSPAGGSPTPEDITNAEKLFNILQRTLRISEAEARRRVETAKTQGTLNQELTIYQERLEQVAFQSDYIFNSFRETTAELKNQNILLNVGRSAFKKLSDIASDISFYQRGSNDLTDKQFKKMGEGLKMRESDLKLIRDRYETEGVESKEIEIDGLKRLGATRLLSSAEKKRLEFLEKEKSAYEAAKNALEQALPLLQKELDFSKSIAKTRQDLGGLATAAAGTISKYGGSLSQFLNIDAAKESVEEYNKELIDKALKSDAVLDALHANELKRIELEAELEGLTGDERIAKLKEIEALSKDDLKIKQEALNSVNKFGNKLGSLKVLVKGLGEGLKKSLTDPLVIITTLVDSLLTGSTGIAAFEKSLGISYGQAYKLNTQLNFVGNNVFDAYINGEKLKKSFIDLSQSMGFVADYGNEALVSMTNLTGKLGLSNQEAAQLTTLSRLQSKDTEKVLTNVGKTVSAMNKQGKTTILLKDVMKEVANVSKATAVTLGSNPVKIAAAVVAAKQLGTTLQQIETTADSLLNFETSIDNELKAELLTGKQLNLERARAAALAGDQETLAKELAENVGSLADFSKMNVIQQKALAEAMGMSREELAKTLLQQEAQRIGAEGVRAKYGEQTYEQLKAQDAQEKFANSVEKLKTAFSSIVQIFSPLIDLLASAAELIANITSKWYILYPLVGIVALSYIPKMAAGFGSLLSSVGSLGGSIKKAFSMEGINEWFGKIKEGLTGAKSLTEKVTEVASETTETIAGKVEDKAKETIADKAEGKITDTISGKAEDKAGELIDKVTGGADDVTEKTKGGGVGGFLKGIKMDDVLKGAAAILILSGALFVAAKAFQEFAEVEWESIAKGGVALLGLTGIAFLLGKMKGPILEGAIAIGILGAALIPLGYALKLAAPGIEAFGEAIKSTFEGIGTIITAAANGIATIFGSLQNVDVMKLLAIGPALIGIGIGLASLGTGGIIGAIGGFLSGDPVEKLKDLAASGDGLTKTATALQAIAGALVGVSAALASIDISKLEALDEFSSNQSSNSITSGIANFITAPIKAIGETISGGDKEEIKSGIDLTPMINAINEVKASVDRLYNKNTSINMDGKKVGENLVQSSRKFA